MVRTNLAARTPWSEVIHVHDGLGEELDARDRAQLVVIAYRFGLVK